MRMMLESSTIIWELSPPDQKVRGRGDRNEIDAVERMLASTPYEEVRVRAPHGDAQCLRHMATHDVDREYSVVLVAQTGHREDRSLQRKQNGCPYPSSPLTAPQPKAREQ